MRILVIARLTFKEASRRKIALTAILMGAGVLVLYNIGFRVLLNQLLEAEWKAIGRQFTNGVQLSGLYCVYFLMIILSALVSADSLAGEISSGAIQNLAAKPLRRCEIVLGKWLGFAGLLAIYLVIMGGGIILSGMVQADFATPNLLKGLALMYLGSLVVMSTTLAWSAGTSTLATGGAVIGLYGIAFIGGWVEQFGAILQNDTAVEIGIISSFFLPTEALWRRASFEMTGPALRVFSGLTPFSAVSVPSDALIIYAFLFLFAALGVGIYIFSRRDL